MGAKFLRREKSCEQLCVHIDLMEDVQSEFALLRRRLSPKRENMRLASLLPTKNRWCPPSRDLNV